MPPKVLASLESQLPSGLVTWLWSSNFKIECYISRLITQLGIKTTFVSCPALLQWRRDACRRLERNTKVSVGVLVPSQPRTRTHTCYASWLSPSIPATRPLVHCSEERPGKQAPQFLHVVTTWEGLENKALVGLLLRWKLCPDPPPRLRYHRIPTPPPHELSLLVTYS